MWVRLLCKYNNKLDFESYVWFDSIVGIDLLKIAAEKFYHDSTFPNRFPEHTCEYEIVDRLPRGVYNKKKKASDKKIASLRKQLNEAEEMGKILQYTKH